MTCLRIAQISTKTLDGKKIASSAARTPPAPLDSDANAIACVIFKNDRIRTWHARDKRQKGPDDVGLQSTSQAQQVEHRKEGVQKFDCRQKSVTNKEFRQERVVSSAVRTWRKAPVQRELLGLPGASMHQLPTKPVDQSP
eukprot:6198059-Pleurochrysis_carterae.AAC.1